MSTPMLRAELLLVVGCLGTGFGLAVIYDLMLLLRSILPCNKMIAGLTDIIFFGAAGLLAYSVIFTLGDGIVRYYAAFSLAAGALLWLKIINFFRKQLQKRRYRRKMKTDAEHDMPPAGGGISEGQ